jgi:hypothetical protein
MRRIRQAWPLLLLTIFWIAQVQGTVHAISHLQGLEGPTKQKLVALGGLCVECAALAQAGAAPLPSPPAPVVLPPSRDVLATLAVVSFAAAPGTFYRSRAPPQSPI